MNHPEYLSKIKTWDELSWCLAADRAAGRKIVFTNGCFDLIHTGHTRYLAQARHLGDRLVVGLNSDDSVRRLKGPTRPIRPEDKRAEVMAALAAVDYVTIFPQDAPAELIALVQPDVLVKGGDWAVERIVGSDLVLARGGRVLSLAVVEGESTTAIVELIQSLALSKK